MDFVARLIVVVVLLVGCGRADAILTVGSKTSVVWTCNGNAGEFSDTSPTVACSAATKRSYTDGGGDYIKYYSESLNICGPTPGPPNYGTVSCSVKRITTFGPGYGGAAQITELNFASVSASWSTQTVCEDGAYNVGTAQAFKCACPTGTKPSNEIGKGCVPISCSAPGTYTAVTQPDQLVPSAGVNICDGGCLQKPAGWTVGADGRIWARWPFYSTGAYCDGKSASDDAKVKTGQENTDNPAPTPCGAGMCPGQVNGANVCVACASQTVQGPSSTSSAPSGSGQQGTATDTQTSCNGQTCTTTTTTTNTTTGAVTGQQQTQQDQKSWCQENPSSPMCKDSLWGGSCTSGFQCDGDAIQCAIARRTYQSACVWENGDPTLTPIGQSAMSAGIQPDGHPAKAAESGSLDFGTTIDQTEYFASGCPADYTITIAGRPVTMPFSSACSSLQMLGNIFVGITMLAAAFIVFRS